MPRELLFHHTHHYRVISEIQTLIAYSQWFNCLNGSTRTQSGQIVDMFGGGVETLICGCLGLVHALSVVSRTNSR